jgi:hypothetical protein
MGEKKQVLGDDSRRIVSINVSTPLIEEALHLPEGYKVIGVEWLWGQSMVRIHINSPDFPELWRGETAPLVEPEITVREIDGNREYTWDWKIFLRRVDEVKEDHP